MSEIRQCQHSVWLVSRHAGAVEWAARQGLKVDHLVDHLEPQQVEAGDIVIGSLPVHLVAEVCQRGGRYMHLSIDLPAELRGMELSADQLEQCHARLEAFGVIRK